MNTASLELCKELYELSGWTQFGGRDEPHWAQKANDTRTEWFSVRSLKELDGWLMDEPGERRYYRTIPAYDLGYLLRKLPKCYPYRYTNSTNRFRLGLLDGKFWVAGYPINDDFSASHAGTADTPEDATAKLAIELFKQGVLKK